MKNRLTQLTSLRSGTALGAGKTSAVNAITLCSATLSEDGRFEPPLGPLYIAAALESVGVEVDFRDFQLQEDAHCFSGDQLARFLLGHQPIVAISCFVDMLPAVVDATRQLSEREPETTIVLGGPGPTAAARRILEEYPWIDAIVRGEGDEAVIELVELLRGKRTGSIAGVIYRNASNLVDGPARARNRSLDDLPLPAYHLIDWTRYDTARVITTRGCSYRCSFCDVTALWGNRSVYRDIELTVREMEMLRHQYGKRFISIVDDTFVLNRGRVREFCRTLIARRSDIQWGCFGRINLMTAELMGLMQDAGCRGIFYGIDSGSQRVLDRTVKRVRSEDILPVIRLSTRYFENIEASFIWGYPFESLADFRKTYEVAAQAALFAPRVNVQLHLLSPLPLSPIYQEFPEALVEPDRADRSWLLLPPIFMDERAERLSALVRAAPDIHPGFYSFASPAKRAKRKSLERSVSVLNQVVGSTFFDPRRRRLLKHRVKCVEREILSEFHSPAEQVGAGLAVSFFRRCRDRDAFDAGKNPFVGTRGASIIRERGRVKGSISESQADSVSRAKFAAQ
jgi:radical SAM superfamily enzyme YgiQ (UPF0313 family)